MKNIIHVIFPAEKSFGYIIESDDSVESLLERVFGEWNGGSGMECELFEKSKCRSLSVNDIVCINGQYFQCDSFGWSKVSVDYVNGLENEVNLHPLATQHGPWFALQDLMRILRGEDSVVKTSLRSALGIV